mmetsp:Transcript_18141/g.24912  ORF Transcript_18141/g.24912 Transcript_18141/m.24912 type:complete len:219 (-) Transcript_18141:1658-2314(-)
MKWHRPAELLVHLAQHCSGGRLAGLLPAPLLLGFRQHGPQIGKQIYCGSQSVRRRGSGEREGFNSIDANGPHLQDEVLERRTANVGRSEQLHVLVEVRGAVQSIAVARPCSARSAFSLVRRSLRNPLHFELGDAAADSTCAMRVLPEGLDLFATAVHHVPHSRDGEGCLRNIRGDNDEPAARRRGFEHLPLPLGGQGGEERQHQCSEGLQWWGFDAGA